MTPFFPVNPSIALNLIQDLNDNVKIVFQEEFSDMLMNIGIDNN